MKFVEDDMYTTLCKCYLYRSLRANVAVKMNCVEELLISICSKHEDYKKNVLVLSMNCVGPYIAICS